MIFLMFFTENDEHVHLLTTEIEQCVGLTSKVFPKTVAGLSGAEVKFQDLKTIQMGMFLDQWTSEYGSVDRSCSTSNEMRSDVFRIFGGFLHNIMFMNWSYLVADSEHSSVYIPDQCLVGKYSHSVI